MLGLWQGVMEARCLEGSDLELGVSKSPDNKELRPQVSKHILGRYHELYIG